MYNEIGTNHVQVNSVRIIKNQDPQPSNGLASIEELPAEDNDVKVIDNEIQGEVNINPIMANRVPIEKPAHHMMSSGSKQKMDYFQ